MSTFDPAYVRAQTTYRADQIREGLLGRRRRPLVRRPRPDRQKGDLTDGL